MPKAPIFGDFIKELRKKLMLTQRDVAERVVSRLKGDAARGFDVTYLSKIENNRLPPPSTAVILSLAVVLETDPDDLLALAGKAAPDIGEKFKKSPKARAFFRSAIELDLSEEDWGRLLDRMRRDKGKKP